MALEVTAFIGTNSRNTWKKVKPCTEVYFNAVICLGLRELIQEIYWAASTDQGHLELNGFEWPNLSGPLATLEIVLPWCEKTSEHRALKPQRGKELCWYDQGNTSVQSDSNWTLYSFSTADQPPHSTDCWIKKWENLINQFQKKFTPIFERKRHTISVWGCLWSTPFRDKPKLRSICPAGMVHTFTKHKR